MNAGFAPRETVAQVCPIDVRGLGRSFGGVVAVAGVSLQVRPGDVLALVGGNGGGKSTTLRMVAGLLQPDTGQGHVLGFDVRRAKRRICTLAAYMPQRIALYPDLSVQENLRFRAALRGLPHPQRAWEATAVRFGLGPALRKPCGVLSEGWARRVQLAATLLGDPPLVLLDEPTAGLDPVSRAEVWAHIAAIGDDGGAVVVSTHDVTEAETCSQVMVLMGGRVAASGSPGNVISLHPGCGSLAACIRRLAESDVLLAPGMLRGAA